MATSVENSYFFPTPVYLTMTTRLNGFPFELDTAHGVKMRMMGY